MMLCTILAHSVDSDRKKSDDLTEAIPVPLEPDAAPYDVGQSDVGALLCVEKPTQRESGCKSRGRRGWCWRR
jgi:hypothetical protein